MKMIKIFEEEMKVQSMADGARIEAQRVQRLVDAFNRLGFKEPLQDYELEDLLADALGLYNQRVNNEVDIPPHFQKDKYLAMITLPSTKELEEVARQTRINLPRDLFALDSNGVTVDQDRLEELQKPFRVYVSENSEEHRRAKKYFAFIDALNSVGKVEQMIFKEVNFDNPLHRLVYIKQVGQVKTAVPALDKLKAFLRK